MLSPDDLLFSYRWNADTYAKLVSDVADDYFASQPIEGVNHPAWLLGHVSVYNPVIVALLKGESFDNPWDAPMGKNSSPIADRSAYASKDQILKTFAEGVDAACDVISSAPAEAWTAPMTHPTWGKQFATVAPAVVYLATTHLALHLGQLSGWRRMMSLPRI